MTRVSLTTSRSPAPSRSGRSRDVAVRRAAGPARGRRAGGPRRGARRRLGDGRRRQVVVEVVEPHGGEATAVADAVTCSRDGRDDAAMPTTRTDQVAVDGGAFDLHVWLPDVRRRARASC